MKLGQALRIVSEVDAGARAYPFTLVSGTAAEPLARFLAAHLQLGLPGRRAEIKTGLFGDLAGNLERYLRRGVEPAAMVIEWADLDPRLGMRQTGGWGREIMADVLETVAENLTRLAEAFELQPLRHSVVLTPPTLPLAPVMPVPGWQTSLLEAGCAEVLGVFLRRVAGTERLCILNPATLATRPLDRVDLKSWWQAGSPYRLPFASELAEAIARAAMPRARAKGIITDLDNTLWSGILGEVGVGGVHWDLEHHALAHGVYQQLLGSLAADGVLLAVASKNDRELVLECLKRRDMLLQPELIFPVEAHWQLKAESVARILQVWNVAPDSVVFIDDNVLEVESMKAAYPTMDCRLFPLEDPDLMWKLLLDLRDLFGKSERREEDTLRLASIRDRAARRTVEPVAGAFDRSAPERVLRAREAELTLLPVSVSDARALELVNKTNQFNLNGERYTEADWLELVESEGALARVASYRDKFGALGKIAVLAGRVEDRRLQVEAWVLSCRAFSRRIEHAMLEYIFEREEIDEICFHFRATERNTPLREFLEEMTGESLTGETSITRVQMAARKPALHLTVATG